MEGKTLARVGAIVFVALAITATAIDMSRKQEPPKSWAMTLPATAKVDPLRAELFRCQALGEAGPRDPSCLRAWAENRTRFLAPGARPAERLPEQEPTPLVTPTPAQSSEAQ